MRADFFPLVTTTSGRSRRITAIVRATRATHGP
jgi:hypothetical protein